MSLAFNQKDARHAKFVALIETSVARLESQIKTRVHDEFSRLREAYQSKKEIIEGVF